MSHPSYSFSEMTFEEWKQRAERELSGPVFREWENAQVPFYFTAGQPVTQVSRFDNRIGAADMRTGQVRSWDNVVYIRDEKAKNANALALTSLIEGADGILFAEAGVQDAEELLNDILPDYASLSFRDVSGKFAWQYRKWLDHCEASHSAVRGYLAGTTAPDFSPAELMKLFRDYPNIRLFSIHLEQAGENNFTTQLVTFLERLTALIDELLSDGIGLKDIWQRMVLSADCGPLFFEEIARLKAIRILVYKIFMAYGLRDIHPEQCALHSISTAWSPEAYQPHVSMLKNCTTGLAAVLGGSTLITLMPEDPASELQARIARNVSLILREESYLDKVVDPAAGSYYIEELTRILAENAWNSFTKSDQAS